MAVELSPQGAGIARELKVQLEVGTIRNQPVLRISWREQCNGG